MSAIEYLDPLSDLFADDPNNGLPCAKLRSASALCNGPAFKSMSMVPSVFELVRTTSGSVDASMGWSGRNGATTAAPRASKTWKASDRPAHPKQPDGLS